MSPDDSSTPHGHGSDYSTLGTPDELPESEETGEHLPSHDGESSVENSTEELIDLL